jgi:histidine triad (HIT) family protein
MPELISRAEALARIAREVGPTPCLMCALRDDRAGPRWLVHEDAHALVVLPRYVRRWGQLLVVPRRHAVSFGEVEPALWSHCALLAREAAVVLERELRPPRCYVASTGSAAEITQSSAHVHLHVIPLETADDRPADLFSWADGVYVAGDGEWRALTERLRAAWLSHREEDARGNAAHGDELG